MGKKMGKQERSKINGENDNLVKKEKCEITDFDKHLFHEGKHYECYRFMGAHITKVNGENGVVFRTWAPNAYKIAVVGDFSNWEIKEEYSMNKINDNGLWSIFIKGLKEDTKYKYAIIREKTVLKADPYAFKSEFRPNTASIVKKETIFKWADKRWLNKRAKQDIYASPLNIYELHLGSWKRNNGKFMTYEEISNILPEYVKEMGYTHVELMPLHEHPLDESWGYQATSYFSPTARFGDSKGLKELVNKLHKNNIGIILDWVPGHFCKDEHGLSYFDGTPTYEYYDNWKANNEGWGALNFDLGRAEVKSYLISNANYWIDEFHIDGLRVDAVSNMLYLNYDRNDGEWYPNIYGGEGNLEAIEFIKQFNDTLNSKFPGVITIAEESSSWPKITHSTSEGGLGFTFKWNMGWMNDTLSYIKEDPIYRKYKHNKMNFSLMYTYAEKFILPISHDEVVHGKKSLVDKMWGDNWSKYAGLRSYSAFMMGHPGKKLMFMGSEIAQFVEWRQYEELQWKIIEEYQVHKQTQNYFKVLNRFYIDNKSLWEQDHNENGFEWINADDSNRSIYSFIRRSKVDKDILVFICNFTPNTYFDFEIGVPYEGEYIEVLNSDALEFGGSGQIVSEPLYTVVEQYNGKPYKLTTKVPPLGVSILKYKVN